MLNFLDLEVRFFCFMISSGFTYWQTELKLQNFKKKNTILKIRAAVFSNSVKTDIRNVEVRCKITLCIPRLF